MHGIDWLEFLAMGRILCFHVRFVVCMQRWVRAFRRDYTLVVHTNNGVEAQNRAFKFEYMAPYRRHSLSSLLVCIVKGFLPDAYRKYVGV